jgi:hypothetical protein
MNAMREQSLSVLMDIEVASDAAPLASRAALARIIYRAAALKDNKVKRLTKRSLLSSHVSD